MAVVYFQRFPGWAEQVGRARFWVDNLLCAHSDFRIPDDTVASAVLLVSEAATNAVRYTASGRGGRFGVTLMIEPRAVTIEVEDEGCPAGGTVPFIRPITPLAQHGRGMTLIDHLAAAWGPLHHPRTGVTFTLTWDDASARRAGRAPATA
ncbi:ATP-binding protein [Nocardiopsis mangrovi]|uniref:ATP-binding protein n=1 Tax=Nocardiopsis mangrovi TaxID=1179818 RepID=A0ABV9E6V7_9ACTN